MIQNVYFLGIGGIGMSALARYYKHAGAFVSGYDLTPSALTRQLENEGIPVHYSDDPSSIPPEVCNNKENTLIIYTPAIPTEHKEWEFFRHYDFRIIKRSVALGHIAENHRTLAIAGTHGKTTTSTLLAHILQSSGEGCTAFLGGISKNYSSNLLLSRNPALVAEADEFDRSFLRLFPEFALITATDADHLDIYGTHAAVKEAFSQFASQIIPGGTLILKHNVDLQLRLRDNVSVYRYAANVPCDYYADNYRVEEDGSMLFHLHFKGECMPDCRLGIPGRLNVENAVGAAAMALSYGIAPMEVKKALASFRGVERRMDIKYQSKTCCYIDDYAHHPEEIRATINSVKEWFPDREITGIFQPHLYTRTRDFADEFALSLSLLDRVILLPVYPARELPIPGVNSEMILKLIPGKDKMILEPSEVKGFLRKEKPSVLLTLGAGNIDRLAGTITDTLKELNA